VPGAAPGSQGATSEHTGPVRRAAIRADLTIALRDEKARVSAVVKIDGVAGDSVRWAFWRALQRRAVEERPASVPQ
jgi:hypothetical protein